MLGFIPPIVKVKQSMGLMPMVYLSHMVTHDNTCGPTHQEHLIMLLLLITVHMLLEVAAVLQTMWEGIITVNQEHPIHTMMLITTLMTHCGTGQATLLALAVITPPSHGFIVT